MTAHEIASALDRNADKFCDRKISYEKFVEANNSLWLKAATSGLSSKVHPLLRVSKLATPKPTRQRGFSGPPMEEETGVERILREGF